MGTPRRGGGGVATVGVRADTGNRSLMGLADTIPSTRRGIFCFYASRSQDDFSSRLFSPRRPTLFFSLSTAARACSFLPEAPARRRFILIPFCNASPGTARKSFPGRKLKGLKAPRNDSTLSYVHYYFLFCAHPTHAIYYTCITRIDIYMYV